MTDSDYDPTATIASPPAEYANDEFWKAYGEYLEESAGRHQKALDALNVFADSPLLWRRHVLDLGCGKHASASWLTDAKRYLGVDVDPPDRPAKLYVHNPTQYNFFKADYRDDLGIIIDTAMNPWGNDEPLFPELVTSLFSIEITDISDNNYAIYQELFRHLPMLKYIVASGFYYTDKTLEIWVEEAGGLKSFQTIDPLCPEPEDEDFTEYRVYLPAPSTLFGPNVVEVWKLLSRKAK